MVKRFLIPVLAFVALGLPASASTVTTYCVGSGCSPENLSAFMNDLGTDGLTLQAQETFTAGDLSGSTYTDPTTGIEFIDYAGNNFSISGASLTTPTDSSSLGETIEIIVPAAILGLEMDVTVPSGLGTQTSSSTIGSTNQTSGFVGFTNPGATGPWTIYLYPESASNYTEINDFTAADMSDTPEVGTMFLIGAGLIAMRWMRRWPRRTKTSASGGASFSLRNRLQTTA